MASAKKRTKSEAQSVPSDATCLTGDSATDQALLELAEVLAEIARTSRCNSTEKEEEG